MPALFFNLKNRKNCLRIAVSFDWKKVMKVRRRKGSLILKMDIFPSEFEESTHKQQIESLKQRRLYKTNVFRLYKTNAYIKRMQQL